MISIDIMLEGLEEEIIFRRGFISSMPDVYGALFIDTSMTIEELQNEAMHYVFVCTEETLPIAERINDSYIICSARSNSTGFSEESYTCKNIAVLRTPLLKLTNHLNLKIHNYQNWISDLKSSKDLQEMAAIASRKCPYPITILNSYFFMDALIINSEPCSKFFESLMAGKRIPSTLAKITLDTERENSSLSCVSFQDNQVRLLDFPIRNNGIVIERIIAEETPMANHSIAQAYLSDFISIIRPILEDRASERRISMNAISTLFADIVDQVLTTQSEIEDRLQYIPDMVKGPTYCPIVIKFERPGSGIPYVYISGLLEQVFPQCSVASFNSGLVVIAHKEQINAPLVYDRNLLYEILNRFGAYAGIGNSSYYLSALRTLYIEASAAARLGQVFCDNKEERIFYYEDYSMYFYVDICIESAVQQHSIQNISYLCEPGLINLIRYDAQNHTRLFETLKGYIDCNCNASLCAQKLFFHRNTVNSRLNLIEELLGASLDNANLIQKLSFSIKIVEYEMKYLHCDPLETTNGKPSLNTEWEHYVSISERPVN